MNTTQDDSFEKLRKVMARTFKIAPETVTPQTALGELAGWDSLGHLTLMMEVEKEFSVLFPTERINAPKNAGEICDLLREVQAAGGH
jgi:acyl carrier protein